MDLAVLIPIVAVVVGVPGFVAFVALIAGHTRKMKELEIRGRELESVEIDATLGPALDALRDDLEDTRAHVAEMRERLDFTERLLAAREPETLLERIPPVRNPRAARRGLSPGPL